MKDMLAKAWKLFDAGAADAAETVYLDCYRKVNSANHEVYTSVLMGLIYVESFLKKYDEARKYAEILVRIANSDEERHVAIHQYGMVERIAGNFSNAKTLFQQEAELIHMAFAGNDSMLSANFYEQAYLELLTGNIDLAEEIMRLSLGHAIKAKDSICIGCACRGMGEIIRAHNDDVRAMHWFNKAIEAFEDADDLIAVEEVKTLAHIS